MHVVALPAAGVGEKMRYSVGILDGYVAREVVGWGVWERVGGLAGWMAWCLFGWCFERSVDWMVMGY